MIDLQGEEYRISWTYLDLKSAKAEKKIKEKGRDKKAKKNKQEEVAGQYLPDELAEGLTDGLVYEEIAEGADLEVILDGANLKENIILKDKHAQTQYVIRYDIGNLIAEETDDHTIILKDEMDETAFTIHAPYMTDAAGAVSEDVSLHLFDQYDGILEVVLTADKQWVKDKERVYPVVVDPYVLEGTKNVNYDASAFENVQGSYYPYGTLAAGDDGSPLGKGKFYVKFDLPELKAGDMVTGGELYLYQYAEYGYVNNGSSSIQLNAHRVTESWSASDVINQPYSSAPASNNTVIDYITASAGTTVRAKNFDISRVVKDWYAGDPNYGICIRADSSTTGGMAKFVAADNPEYPSCRPFITVRYLNNKGLEDRWTYHSQSPGEKSTGYVNDYTGNLVYTVPLVETTGKLMPVSLSLVYNGYQKGRVDQITTVGKGWRLNIQQRVIKLTADNTGGATDDINSLYDSLYEAGYRYIYEDADGTDHYFRAKKNSTTVFVDEEGLGLELSAVTGSDDSLEVTKIVAEDGSKLTFTSRGYLRCAYDSDGNFYKVYYSTSVAGAVTSVQDGSGRGIAITRDTANNNRITKVTDPSGRIVELAYTSGGRIYTVKYPDDNMIGFAYTDDGRMIRVKGTDNSRIKYTYDSGTDASVSHRVKTITEYSRQSTSDCLPEHQGQQLTLNYGKNRTSFTDTSVSDSGFKEVYQFDNYGRTIAVNDSDGAFNSYAYINPASGEVSANSETAHHLSSSHTVSKYVENLLNDHSFEDGTSAYTWTNAASSKEAHYLGQKSAKLASPNDVVSQRYDASSGNYTFSAYVKTSGSGVLPKLRVAFYDASGNRMSYTDSKPRQNQLNWSRLHLSFSVPEGTAYFRVACRMEGEGTAYFDALQLETGKVMNKYNLVENSDFDKALSGTWTEYNTVSADARKTDSGKYYYLTGEGGKAKRLYQKIEINKPAKNLYFAVSGLGTATSVPFTNSSKRFALTLHTVFGDGTTADKVIRFNPDYLGAQYTAGVAGYSGANADKTVNYIEIRCVYNYNENHAEFDKIRINLDESGTSYTYDDEGNLITAADNAGRNQTYTYSDAGEILTATSADNKRYEYTYATGNKHRLVSAVSKSSDIKFSYEYNGKGQMNAQQVQAVDSQNNGTGKKIRTNQYYTESKNYIKEEYDDRGFGYQYDWGDEKKGLISTVTDPNGNTTSYTYDSNDDYLKSAAKGGSTVSYTYDSNNYLTKVQSGSTAYHFGYDQYGNVQTTKAGSDRTLATNTYNEKNGNLKNTVYGNGFKLGYTYDQQDRVTAAFHNGTSKYKWIYNADGQVGRHEDSISGRTYQYTYDLAGRLLRTDVSDGSMLRAEYNDISLPTEFHYTVADAGGRDVYYTYAARDNLPKTTTFGSTRVATNTYDGLGRLDNTKYTTPSADVKDVVADYTYLDWSEGDRTTTYVNNIDYTYVSGDLSTDDRFYTYGAAGNITKEYKGNSNTGTLQEQYTYDSKGQVTKHYSARNKETWVYTYDNAGNILTKKRYDGVTTPEQLSAASAPTETVNYTYGDSQWGDLLTSYNGKTVTSDAIGNMLGYDGQSWSWSGRQLDSYTKADGTKTTYKYNALGIRTSKTTGNKTTEFFLNGNQVLMMKTTDGTTEDIIWFFYDSEGNRVGLCRNGTYMYYLYNVQGDVIAIASAGTGKLIATYTYDTWGNCTVSELSGYAIGDLNPFRYRGYFWDEESGMYYLNSRYYSPEFGRFISADECVSEIGGNVLGNNLFTYCFNNPVNLSDVYGNWPEWAQKIGNGLKSIYTTVTTKVKTAVSSLKNAMFSSDSTKGNKLPTKGEPGSSRTLSNPDGTPKQKRWYGPDGKPTRDRDYNHAGDMSFPHDHVWENGKRRKEHLPPSPSYTFSLEPVIGVALVGACAFGMVVLAADDVTGIGIADDVLIAPLSAGVGRGVLMIFP